MGLGLGLGLVCSSAFSTGMEEPTVVGGTAVSLTSPSPDVVSVSADSSAVGSGMLVNLSSDVEAAGAVASVFSASPEGLQNESFNILSYPDPILVQLTTIVNFSLCTVELLYLQFLHVHYLHVHIPLAIDFFCICISTCKKIITYCIPRIQLSLTYVIHNFNQSRCLKKSQT